MSKDKPTFEEVLSMTNNSIKSRVGGVLNILGLLTGCGSREIEEGKEEMVQRVKNNPFGIVVPDIKFNGTDSADAIVESIIEEAKRNGAWEGRKAERPRITIVEEIDGGTKLAQCDHIPYGIEEGSKSPQGDLRITRKMDNSSPEKRREIIAHELGHCIWGEQDNEDSGDLMYFTGSSSRKGRDKEQLEEMMRKFWDRNK